MAINVSGTLIPTTVAQGDLTYGTASQTIGVLSKDTNSTRYLSNQGTNNNPSWTQINLTNGVTGALPVANGGTGVTSKPAAGAYIGSNVTLAANGYTIITMDTEEYDIGSYHDVTTNKGRYTPGVAGLYRVSWAVDITNPQTLTLYGSALHKNGSVAKAGWFGEATTSILISVGCAVVSLNGSTDYIDIRGYNGHASTTATAGSGAVNTWLAVEYIGPSS